MWDKLRSFSRKVRQEVRFYRLVLRDRETPVASRLLLGLALLYLVSPIDLVPEFIPVLGSLDDLIIVTLLVYLAMKMVPARVVDRCRTQTLQE